MCPALLWVLSMSLFSLCPHCEIGAITILLNQRGNGDPVVNYWGQAQLVSEQSQDADLGGLVLGSAS